MKKKKNIIISVILLSILTIFAFSYTKEVKNLKFGNNKSSQDMVDNILNMKTYNATIEVTVNSNKNENKYLIKQIYNEKENSQEVIEPSNIRGVKITKTENELKIENTNLNLVSIYENYNYISENDLDLNCFVDDYMENESSKFEENSQEIKMKTYSKNNSNIEKILYINKKEGLPERLDITDTIKKTTVYILYREVNINS